jgi:CRP-like cAMP-binding protein
MDAGALGRTYPNGEVIVRQGEAGKEMYVVLSGKLEVVADVHGREVAIAVLVAGDVFGEMALFEREVRSATVRALGEARVLTIEKSSFLRRVHEDPSLAFRILEQMSRRIRGLLVEVAELKASRS